jgi:hypothetical protein
VNISSEYIKKGGDVFLKVCVCDNGVGIDTELVDKLFKIGEKVRKVGTNKEIGTGLGLIICKELIDKQGGDIWVESELGMGSKFMFTIPVKKNSLNDIIEINEFDETKLEITTPIRHKKYTNIWKSFIFILVVVLFTVSTCFLRTDTNTYKQYYTVSEDALFFRSDKENIGMEEYSSGDYNKAIEIFKRQKDVTSKFYLGLSYMKINKFQDAILPFHEVIKQNNMFLNDKAYWYSGLCYLKLNQKNNAIKMFTYLSNKNGQYKKDAVEILKNIK